MCLHHHQAAPGRLARRDLLNMLAAAGLGAASLPLVRRAEAAGFMSFLDHDAFVEGMSHVIETAASSELEAFTFFRLGPNDLPWQPLGLEAKLGQKVTFLVGGRLWLSREHDLWIEPGCALHVRSADIKPMYNPMLNNGTMTAAHDGAITIARSMAEWENEDGELWTPVDAYTQADVDIFGVALRWRGDAEVGMESLLAGGDVAGAIGRELGRLRTSQPLPKGWHNHFNAGGDDVIFRSGGLGQIVCQSHKTGGLLRHPAELPLVPDTRLSWRWVIEELPSLHPENSLVTHDYLSVGVEFDDGQDLTYLWSHSLPVGEVFRCPIPRWNPIETHMIIRSGFDGMGEWMAEERDVFADYQTHIGGEAQNIVRVWLLAVTIFQRRSGACRYADIKLASPSQELVVL